jgi:hypothetical protein
MKILIVKKYTAFIVLLFCNICVASNNPPQPAAPLPPPPLPLSNEMIMLVIPALIFAFYKYKKSFKIS